MLCYLGNSCDHILNTERGRSRDKYLFSLWLLKQLVVGNSVIKIKLLKQ